MASVSPEFKVKVTFRTAGSWLPGYEKDKFLSSIQLLVDESVTCTRTLLLS